MPSYPYTSHNSIAVITDKDVKKSHVATAVTHIQSEYFVVKQSQIQTVNVTPIEAELMAIHIGLIPAMEDNNIHNITVITDSISAASKVLESKVDPFQNMVIPIAYTIKQYPSRDGRNRIQFWYYPSKAEWPRHKLVNNQVKVGTNALEFSCKNSHLFSRKKECDNILQEWQSTFANSLKRGHYFLMFENKDQ